MYLARALFNFFEKYAVGLILPYSCSCYNTAPIRHPEASVARMYGLVGFGACKIGCEINAVFMS